MEEIDESPRQAGERAAFSRLCESIKDLPPKEQVSRVNEYFGIFGGAPPPKGGVRGGNGQALSACIEREDPVRRNDAVHLCAEGNPGLP